MEKDQLFFRKDRISTGVRELDIALEGGYLNPGTVMALGPSGQEKLALAFHFAMAGLAAGERVMYICLDMTPAEIESKAASFGMNFRAHTNKGLVFVDVYSKTIGAVSRSRSDIIVPGPAALNDLSIVINDVAKQGEGKRMRAVFHSLSILGLHSSPESTIKFLQVAEGRLKAANATTLWLVDEGLHEKKFISSLENLSDEVLRVSEKEGFYELYIPGIPIPLQIRAGAAGLEII